MNVSRLRHRLKAGHIPQARLLMVGEEIESGDVVVMDAWVESPSETSIGQTVKEKETILRLTFA